MVAGRVINTPYAVLEAVVRGSWEDKVGPAELLDVSQSLELGCVDDLDEERVQLDVTVDGVVKHLAGDAIAQSQHHKTDFRFSSRFLQVKTNKTVLGPQIDQGRPC